MKGISDEAMQLVTAGRAIDAYDDFKDIVEQLLSAYKRIQRWPGRLVGPQVALRPTPRESYSPAASSSTPTGSHSSTHRASTLRAANCSSASCSVMSGDGCAWGLRMP